jgi:hypothetical protein
MQCYQISGIGKALLEVSENTGYSKVKKEKSESLFNYKHQNSEFILATVVRNDILLAMNTVRATESGFGPPTKG